MNTIYFGIIEDRDDPLKLGRCKVRVVGLHTHNILELPTVDLPWATVVQPVSGGSNAASMAPTEGTEVMIVFADEPDCQIPIVVGVIPTLPQRQHVWLNNVPGAPKVKDIISYDIGHSLPRSQAEDALSKSAEISEGGLTTTDKNNARDVANNADGNVQDSIHAIGGSTANPAACGRSTLASTIRAQYGQANPTMNQKLLVSEMQMGSKQKAIEAYAEKIVKTTGISLAKDIIKGKTSIGEAMGKLSNDIASGVSALGKEKLESVFGDIYSKFKGSGGSELGEGLSALAGGFGDLSNAFDGGLSFDNIGKGLDSIEGILDGVIGLESGLSSLVGGESGVGGIFDSILEGDLFEGIGDKLGDMADSAMEYIENFDTDKLLSIADSVLEMDLSGIGGPVGNVLATMRKFGIDTTNIKSIIKSFTGAGGIDFKLQFDASGLADAITRKIRDLMSSGIEAATMAADMAGKMKGYAPSIGRILSKAAKAGFVTGINANAIATAVYNFFDFIEKVIRRMLAMAVIGAGYVVQWVTEQINALAASFLDIFNGLEGIIEEILNMIPFTNIIVNMVLNYVTSFIPGMGDDEIDFGIGPDAIRLAIDSGTYNSNAFNGVGNRKGIDEQGKGNLTSDAFANVGEGNTPPIHGRWGGPNFGGSKSAPDTAAAINAQENPSLTTRMINATEPDIPGFTGKGHSGANIQTLVGILPGLGLGTIEAMASFLAVSYAYCKCYPQIRDYEYTEKQQLLAKFPRTFSHATEELYRNYLFARSLNKCSISEFYNFVYDSAQDGQALGNSAADDGYRYAEAGLLPLVGKNSYQAYGIKSAQEFIGSLEMCAKVAVQQFLKALNGIPSGNINACIMAAITAFGVDRDVAIKAFEHFYGAKLYDSFKVNEKVAGKGVDANGYYGSAQEDVVITGFRDPNGKYPYNRNSNTSTISKLAAGDKVNTIVTSKESRRRIGIPIANDQGTWDQPHSSYAAQYPYNTVRETESGHVQEFDDTPGHERIHTYHRSGTFTEIDSYGSKVTRIVGDDYTLIDRNGFIFIAGNANVTCTGNINIYCQSDTNIEADGTVEIKAHGNMNLAAANDININAGGNINMWSGEAANLQCNKNMNVRSVNGAFYVTAEKDMNLYAKERAFLTAENKTVDIYGKTSVSIEGEEMDVNIKGGHNVNVDGGYALQLKAKEYAALSGGNDVDINSGQNLRLQALLNMTVLTAGWYRQTVGLATDISSGGYLHMAAGAEAELSALGALTCSAMGALSLGATGLVNIDAGAAMTIGAKGALSVNAGGTLGMMAGAAAMLTAVGSCGINGSVVGLNSHLLAPVTSSVPAITVPTLPAGFAMKASGSSGAVPGTKALIYGMVSIAPRIPVYPNITPLTTDHPLLEGEQVIEDEDQLQQADAQLIEKSVVSETGRKFPIEGPKITDIPDNGVDHKPAQMLENVKNNLNYNANTKISEHFKLNDMFDGGFNRKHILQDQAGFTKDEIVCNLCNLAENVLEPLLKVLPGGIDGYRKQWGINSGYRSTKNNANTKNSSKTSQHCKGQAVDIQIYGQSKSYHYELIQKVASAVRFDQLILEYSPTGRSAWIHCSYVENRCRKQCLTINLCAPKGKQTSKGFVQYA